MTPVLPGFSHSDSVCSKGFTHAILRCLDASKHCCETGSFLASKMQLYNILTFLTSWKLCSCFEKVIIYPVRISILLCNSAFGQESACLQALCQINSVFSLSRSCILWCNRLKLGAGSVFFMPSFIMFFNCSFWQKDLVAKNSTVFRLCPVTLHPFFFFACHIYSRTH